MYSDLQFKLIRRETATGYPSTGIAITGLQQNCTEEVGWSIFEIAGSSGPIEIPMGSIHKGKFLLLSTIEDSLGVRNPLSIHINGSSNVSGTGTVFGIEFDDDTGLTSLYVTNGNTDAVRFYYYIGGDVS